MSVPWATAKSIAKWTWTRYTGDRRRRGVLKLDASNLSLSSRQQLGAKWTHRARKEKTAERIVAAIRRLLKLREKITATAVARGAGITRQTIAKRYGYLLEPAFIDSLRPQRRQRPSPTQTTAAPPIPKPPSTRLTLIQNTPSSANFSDAQPTGP